MNKIKTVALGFLATAILSGCGSSTAQQTKAEDDEVITSDVFETREIEGMDVTWIQDNAEARNFPTALFAECPDSIYQKLGLQNGIPSTISTYLVEAGNQRILFDTGNGTDDSLLFPSLSKMGVSPADINYIYITHLHGDHIGGLVQNDTVAFPNATIYLAKQEYEAYKNMDAEKNQKQMAYLGAYEQKGQLKLFEYGDTLPGNFVSIAAVGHTPGHTIFQHGKLVVVGDLLHGAALQLEYPQYCPSFDANKEEAIANRVKYLDYMRQNHLIMAGMHMPAPGFIEF